MTIQCPKCGFSREVPEDKLPASASIATCPKCAHKFKFRDLPRVTRLRDYHEERDEPTSDTHPRPGEHDEPDGRGNEAPVAGRPGQAGGQVEPAASANRPARAPRPPAEGDIWQRLESMRSERQESPGQDDQEAPAKESGLPEDEGTDEASARGDATSIEAPWERTDKFGVAGGFVQTVKRATLHPQAFFGHMPLRGMAKPLAFFLLVGCIQLAAQLGWGAAGMTFMDLVTQRPEEASVTTSLGEGGYLLFIIFPLVLTTLLFAMSGLNHLFLMATKAANRGFEATFRAVAYGSAPLVLSVIPYAGDMLGLVWNLAVTIIAYKYIHRTSYARVALAMLIPFAFMFALGLFSLGAT